MPIGTSMNAIGIADNEYYTDGYMQDDKVNEYEDGSSYANYGYESDRSYENNNYDRDYPSYKDDYKSNYHEEYKSYDNNDYKSKDKEQNIVSISNINCNTVNYNFNNVAIGNFSNGNSGIGGAALGDGSNGDLSTNSNGDNQGYYDGYKNEKGITCIDNINNTNTNIATGDDGNATDGDGNLTTPCEDCFINNLDPNEVEAVENALEIGLALPVNGEAVVVFSIAELCEALDASTSLEVSANIVTLELFLDDSTNIPLDAIINLIACLEELYNVSGSGLSDLTTTGGGLSTLPTAPSLGLP